MNQLLKINHITITLQWLREAEAVYHIKSLPQTPHTEVINATTVMINLTISYNIQYNVSIVLSLCGVTTTKVLRFNYGKYM